MKVEGGVFRKRRGPVRWEKGTGILWGCKYDQSAL
jgi:hypothetical protein